jgi:hypothetical protein
MCQGPVFSYPPGEIESRYCALAPWIKGSLGIIYSTSQLESCPDCFPLADPRSALPEESLYKHYPGTGGEENRSWADLDSEADFWSASDVCNRAELFNAAVPHNEDIRLFVCRRQSQAGWKSRTILSDVLRFFIWDFWERSDEGARSRNPPTIQWPEDFDPSTAVCRRQ